MDIIVKNTRELSRRFRAAAGRGAGGAHTKKNESQLNGARRTAVNGSRLMK